MPDNETVPAEAATDTPAEAVASSRSRVKFKKMEISLVILDFRSNLLIKRCGD